MASEPVRLVVADLDDGRFAVLKVYPERRKEGGCVAIVQSIHKERGAALEVCHGKA